jgi:hypothetical protein
MKSNAVGLIKTDLIVVGLGLSAAIFIGLGVSGFHKSVRETAISTMTTKRLPLKGRL